MIDVPNPPETDEPTPENQDPGEDDNFIGNGNVVKRSQQSSGGIHAMLRSRPLASALLLIFTAIALGIAVLFVRSEDGGKKGGVDGSIVSSSKNVLPTDQNSSAAEWGDEDDPLIDVYFGCGCFWHVQHEFVMAEREILGRTDEQITARAGYAGGLAGSEGGKVCYHNKGNVADYGKLGHAEVVGLTIPKSTFGDFVVEYFKLFDAKGNRPDQSGDRGSEYRSQVGVPGEEILEFTKILADMSIASEDKLNFEVGHGNDGDIRKVSFVMDIAEFPFYKAEQHHQFHDGFRFNEHYPRSYNKLASMFAKSGEDFGSCP